jgi:hypothetical protein
MRKLLLSVMLAMALAIGSAATAVASPPKSYQDTVVGIETAKPLGPTSTFAGYAFGELPGFWTASVDHGSLPTSPGEVGAITGGSFALKNRRFGVVGVFGTGTITMLRSSAGGGFCTQTYQVSDTLSLVAPTTGVGSFGAILTHYGSLVAGQCIPFFATVYGSVTLTF